MADRSVVSWGLLFRGRQICIKKQSIIIGRGSACDIVLDDPLASRQHVRLAIVGDAVLVDDLGSANGTYLNEQRLIGPARAGDGDRILIGTQEMSLFAGIEETDFMTPPPNSGADRNTTVVAIRPGPAAQPTTSPPPEDDESTIDEGPPIASITDVASTRRKPAQIVSDVVRRMVARGDQAVARRLLSGYFDELIEDARAGESVADRVPDVARACLALAVATSEGGWVTRVFEAYSTIGRPLDEDVLQQTVQLLKTLPGVSAARLQEYQVRLAAGRDEFSLSDQTVVDRIACLSVAR